MTTMQWLPELCRACRELETCSRPCSAIREVPLWFMGGRGAHHLRQGFWSRLLLHDKPRVVATLRNRGAVNLIRHGTQLCLECGECFYRRTDCRVARAMQPAFDACTRVLREFDDLSIDDMIEIVEQVEAATEERMRRMAAWSA